MSKTRILDPYMNDMQNLYGLVKQSNEFEIDFNKNKDYINYEKYILVLEYLSQKRMRDKNEIQKTISLDINYSESDDLKSNSYRMTLNNQLIIDKYMDTKILGNRKNHVIMNALMKLHDDKKMEGVLELMKKTKESKNIYDIDDYNIRVRLTEEIPFNESDVNKILELDETSINKIMFRYKQRVSLIVEEDDAHVIRIDLTDVTMANSWPKLKSALPNYELELELMLKKNIKKPEYLEKMCDVATTLLKILQQSNFVISASVHENVLLEYGKILSLGKNIGNTLDGRQPLSLEIQYVTDAIANKYAVTDKADGDRYFLIICFDHVYIISNTLVVKDIGIDISKKEYNGTILDGEYIFLPKHNRHLFMAFDCLYAKGVDMRKNNNLMERLHAADDVIENCFILATQKGFKYTAYKGDNNNESYEKFHKEELTKYLSVLSKDIQIEKRYPLIRRKYFIPVNGVSDNEIFKYSMVVWNQQLYSQLKYPYNLDGIIYQPLNQAYVTNARESKYSDYKWKPPEKNSIDFYITFERDRNTGKILNVFDNSNEEYVKNKPYHICYLYVGKKNKDFEQPVLFQNDNSKCVAHLFLDNGEVRDLKGNIIQDKTVVEFYYEIASDADYKYRWIPIRTRYDKTEMVQKYKKRYGNYYDTANRVWRSIINPILIDDIQLLANDATYSQHLSKMRSKIGHDIIMSVAKENVYYQVKTNLAKPMRDFHNWIKDLMIWTYCSQLYNGGKKRRIFDVGCGRGGDLMKFYPAQILEYVGMDPENETLNNAVDGAVSRYTMFKRKYPAFPRCTFICADFTVPLNAENQIGVIKDPSKQNEDLIKKFLPTNEMGLFDVMNCQFTFHFFLKNDLAWDSACYNINKCVKPGGYMLLSLFDGHEIVKMIGDKNNYTIYYTDKGEKKILIDIVKKYKELPKDNYIGVGYSIDVHTPLISKEDVYVTEYLVDKNFLVDELKKKCDMELIDTDMFGNQFMKHKNYMTHVIQHEENPETHKFLKKLATYYDQDNELNKACLAWTKLCRYYVFRKMGYSKTTNVKKIDISTASIKEPMKKSLKPKVKKI